MGMRPVDLIPLVTIAAFHPAAVFRDGQPDAGMAKRAFAAVTGNFPFGDNFGFWRGVWHEMAFLGG